MKRLLIMLISVEACAMDTENQLTSNKPSSTEIISQISSLLIKYDQTGKADDDRFQALVVSYFKRESLEIQHEIEPHLKEKLRNSDSDIRRILIDDDEKALKILIHRLITESVEDAFKGKNDQFAELKELADTRLKKARLALIGTIATGAIGVLGTFLGVYFGRG